MLWAIVQSVINGILQGGTYALLAVGTTIVFGVMRTMNFANGSFFMFGMYLTWGACYFLGGSIYAMIPVIVILMAGLGYISFRGGIRPVVHKNRAAAMVVTVGIAYVLQNLSTILFGATPLNVASSLRYASLIIGDFVMPWLRLIALAVALLLTGVLTLILNKTYFGRCMRTTSENRDVAKMLGVNTDRIFVGAWMLGIVLSGLSGLLLSPLYNITPSIGVVFRSIALAACVLGGLGDIRGAFISGIMLGIVEAFTSVFISSDVGQAGMYIMYLLVLQFKPLGLFGKGERVA